MVIYPGRKEQKSIFHTQMIHVGNIYLHFPLNGPFVSTQNSHLKETKDSVETNSPTSLIKCRVWSVSTKHSGVFVGQIHHPRPSKLVFLYQTKMHIVEWQLQRPAKLQQLGDPHEAPPMFFQLNVRPKEGWDRSNSPRFRVFLWVLALLTLVLFPSGSWRVCFSRAK